MPRPDILRHDGLLIIGAGLAGLSAALACAPRRALVVCAAPLTRGCASSWAQGGMAAALGEDDDPALHAADTVAAGAGLVDAAMAQLLTADAPQAVRRLAELGAPFDRTADGRFIQSLEAAHSHARVARVKGDQAGQEIMRAAAAAAMAAPHIELRSGARLRGLLQDDEGRIRGALVEHQGRLTSIIAPATLLASGGVGGLFAVTTNPRELLGEGLGLAALAGAVVADAEFVQFHPTAIAVDVDPAPLASEALRGEGAMLLDASGERFMSAEHPLGDLAPRDVVARAIHRRIVSGSGAFLDARKAVGAVFPDQFPAVFAACMAAGIDPRTQPIPVAPAAHYHMGGLATDALARTSLEGLYAAGECACTGVHGANRLASNSLLEAAVFGTRAGVAAREQMDPATEPVLPAPAPDLPGTDLPVLRRTMSAEVGVTRDAVGLERALEVIDRLRKRHGAAPALAAAQAITASALNRRESRGAHHRTDYPQTDAVAVRSLVRFEGNEMRPYRSAAA